MEATASGGEKGCSIAVELGAGDMDGLVGGLIGTGGYRC
jgi:hypothetical protein